MSTQTDANALAAALRWWWLTREGRSADVRALGRATTKFGNRSDAELVLGTKVVLFAFSPSSWVLSGRGSMVTFTLETTENATRKMEKKPDDDEEREFKREEKAEDNTDEGVVSLTKADLDGECNVWGHTCSSCQPMLRKQVRIFLWIHQAS